MPDFDFSELTALAADLGKVSGNISKPLRNAIKRTSGLVKKDAQDSVGGSAHWGQLARTINYDTTESKSGIESEIGYDKSRGGSGKLGNLREFGAPGAMYGGKAVPLAPRSDLANALHKNEDDFTKGVNAAIDDALKASNL